MKRVPRPKIPPSVVAEQHRVACGRPPCDEMPDDVCAEAMRHGVIDEVEVRAEAIVLVDNVTYAAACRVALEHALGRTEREEAA